MNYIVYDLEWNQPRSAEEKVTDPVTLSGEIIQIGAVKMDEKMNIVGTYTIMVEPVYYRTMNSAVKKLTGIDDEDLRSGVPFAEAYRGFLEFCGENFTLLTWGGDDMRILTANMAIHGIKAEKPFECINIQRVFGRQIAKTKKQISLENAVEMTGEPPYRAHDALNDAMSSALVCKHMDLRKEAASKYTSEKKKGKPLSKKMRCFLKNTGLLRGRFGIVPLLYGSLGLEYLTGEELGADDIDILVPRVYLRERWNEFRGALERHGYVMTDAREHTFVRDGVTYAYAELEELETFADIQISDIAETRAMGKCFLLLSLPQYLKVYRRSETDGYRIHTREKKDREKIEVIEKKLKNK